LSYSQKCQYALHAVLELAKAGEGRATKIGEVAERQRIPVKFLEAILNELRRGGFVQSRRGSEGGYLLARPARRLTVGDIVRFVEGPLAPMGCGERRKGRGSSHDRCVFRQVWREADKALSEVYDGVTFQDLLDRGSSQAGDDFVI
jgi:Rrf2 family protein